MSAYPVLRPQPSRIGEISGVRSRDYPELWIAPPRRTLSAEPASDGNSPCGVAPLADVEPSDLADRALLEMLAAASLPIQLAERSATSSPLTPTSAVRVRLLQCRLAAWLELPRLVPAALPGASCKMLPRVESLNSLGKLEPAIRLELMTC